MVSSASALSRGVWGFERTGVPSGTTLSVRERTSPPTLVFFDKVVDVPVVLSV